MTKFRNWYNKFKHSSLWIAIKTLKIAQSLSHHRRQLRRPPMEKLYEVHKFRALVRPPVRSRGNDINNNERINLAHSIEADDKTAPCTNSIFQGPPSLWRRQRQECFFKEISLNPFSSVVQVLVVAKKRKTLILSCPVLDNYRRGQKN